MSAKITAALHAVMSEVSYVQKTGKNAFHGYSYAGEADLLSVLRPAMLKHGLMLFPSVENVSPVDEHGNVTVMMSYSLVHKDGDVWPTPLNAAGMGNDRAKNGSVGDKGVYKAITGANKYLLFKLFQIETGDDPETMSAHDEVSGIPDSSMLNSIDNAATSESLTAAFGGAWRSTGDPTIRATYKARYEARKKALETPAPSFDNLPPNDIDLPKETKLAMTP